MKVVALLVLFACLAYADEEKYSTKYDDFDVDEILNNRRLLVNYMKCVLREGKCTKEGLELREYLPDAIKTDCVKCSTKQKEIGKKVLKHIYEKEKEYFKKLEEKYDPDGVYRKRYAEEAKKEGIIL